MNSDFNVSDENIRRKQSQIVRTIRHNSKRIVSREAFRDSDGNKSHENFFHWNNQFQQKFFVRNEITIFRNLRTESLYIWLKAKDIAV